MKKLIALILIAVLCLSLAACGAKGPTLADVKKAGKLVVATSPDFPPFENLEGGEVVGIEVEIMELICAELGVELELKQINFDAVLTGVQSGKYDLEEDRFNVTVDSGLAILAGITEKVKAELISEGDRPVEYAFIELTQYGKTAELEAKTFDSPGAMLDAFFDNRDREQRVRQRASDVLHILTNTEQRLRKKMELQRGELTECEQGELFKKQGDLITANLYQLKKGMKQAVLVDYEDWHEDGSYGEMTVELDERLSPAANAQRLYKKYNKAKNARVMLTEQLRKGEEELAYIYTVFDALTHAETAADLAEIRDELYRSGYASRMKSYTQQKQKTPTVAQFVTDGGYTVLCGKNNVQNEYITHKLAEKTDYWFHVKGQPGSHVLMVCHGEEPGEKDFTQAAEIAAYYSKAAGAPLTAVDYTFARHVKKPSGGKPGLVIYHTNWTAYVSPRAEEIQRMRVK